MKDLKVKIIEKVSRGELNKEFAFELLKALQGGKERKEIAIIGMAGKFPGAEDLDQFWTNLAEGVCSIGAFPAGRRKDTDIYLTEADRTNPADPYLRGGYLPEIDKLDAEFFRISPKEAQLMDPYQRLFLETAWEAIEDAGYAGEGLNGTKTGLYVGRDFSDGSFYKEIMTEPNPLAVTGLATSILASRVAYILNLQGPAVVIDTACSSSLVALHLACQAMQSGECEAAIVGGIALSPNPVASVGVGVDSADATVRAFDKDANGTVWGEGAGVLILKPLEQALKDGDRIYALVKGSAINNDGTSNGLVAPKAETQEEVIVRAWEEAKISPETISYIESHGTGTQLGDPIEIKGLTDAFKRYTGKKQFCYIGSLKPSIGHLVGASGIASVIKAVLAMQNRMIPASLHFTEPNPFINFVDSPLAVNTRLTPWEVESAPRRAGVTSLGFSGTNCHVVLEEYAQTEPHEATEDQTHILTLSANSEHALLQLVKSYQTYLPKLSRLSLTDLCYTANTGRSQHRCRLALIFESREELQRLLARLLHGDFAAAAETEQGIFYGTHRLVGYKATVEGDELSESERISLSQVAASKSEELANADPAISSREMANLLAELAQVYVRGAEVKWAGLYRKGGYRKMKLPGYPFERKRHWIKAQPKGAPVPPALLPGLLHPLVIAALFDQTLEMPDQRLALTAFSLERHWVLREHRIQGMCIIPGTTYIEMLLEAAEPMRAGRMVEIENLTFVMPLVVQDEETKVAQTILKPQGDLIEYTVLSKTDMDGIPEDQRWLRHAMGKFRFTQAKEAGSRNLEEIKARCPEVREIPDENYDIKGVYEMGLRWRNIRKVHVGTNEVLGYLELNPEFTSDLQEYLNHPALMDMAVGVASQVVENSREYLPFAYKKLRVYANLPQKIYSYAVKKDSLGDKRETVAFDITIMDEMGKILLEIDEYMIKKVNQAELRARGREPIYYETRWIKEAINVGDSVANTEQSAALAERVLILRDINGLADALANQLRAAGNEVFEAVPGNGYAKLAEKLYEVGDSEEDYRNLLAAVTEEGRLNRVIHLATVGHPQVASEADLKAAEQCGVFSLFNLAKALLHQRSTEAVELILVSDSVNEVTGREDMLKPEFAAFYALGKVIGQENPKLITRCIDLDVSADEELAAVTESLAATVLGEINAPNTTYQVAYREGQRFIEEIGKADLTHAADKPIQWKEGGVYIITGGTGGLGLAIGKWLASKFPVKLALINRSALPARENWPAILATGDNVQLTEKLKSIQQMESKGTEVTCYATDVANGAEMEKVIADIRIRYGQINGIIHAAGLAGEGLFITKDRDHYTRVLAPKIQGTWHLERLTAQDELDFFVLFSSLNSILGGPGQSDYAAANAYMDTYAAESKKRGRPTIAINWPAWREAGMAVQYGVNLEGGVFKAIGLKAGLEVLDEVLGKDLLRILVGEINYEVLTNLPGKLPVRLAKEITAAIERKKKQTEGKAGRSATSITEVAIREDNGQLDEIERKVAAIWGSALGLDEVSLHDNFYDLGGDSIIAITIANNLSEAFKIEFPLEEIFSNPTIDGISKVVPNLTGTVKFKKVERRRKM